MLVARRGRGARARLQRGPRLPACGDRPARADAAVVLVQLPARHVRRLQRPRLEPGGRPRAGGPRPRAVDRRRRDRAVGRPRWRATTGWTGQSSRRSRREFGIAARQALEEPAREAARDHPYGTGDKRVTVKWEGQARRRLVGHALPGRRQRDQAALCSETTSESMRAVATAATSASERCRACKGQRLRPESRAVFVAGKSLVDVTAHDGRAGGAALRGLELTGARGADRRPRS